MNNELEFVPYQGIKAHRDILNSIKAPDQLVQLTPQEFEFCCAYLYSLDGYSISQNTQTNRDIDLLLEQGHERVIVQCRRFVDDVTALDVDNLASQIPHAEATAAILITNSTISRPAEAAAENKAMTLVSGESLYNWLRYTQAMHYCNQSDRVDSSWGKVTDAFVGLILLIMVVGMATVGYQYYARYTQNGLAPVATAAPVVSAELQPTMIVLRQTPPKETPLPTETLLAKTETEIEASATPLPTPTQVLPTYPVLARFASPPPLNTNLAHWSEASVFTTTHVVANSAEITTTAASVWRLGWDSSNLYGIVVVEDDAHVQTQPAQLAYAGDSIELEIDGNNDKSAAALPNDFQYIISPGNFFNHDPAAFRYRGGQMGIMNEFIGTQAAVDSIKTDAGYIVAFKIPWFDMGMRSPIAGTTLGIAMNLNDNDTVATAQQEAQYSHTPGRQWSMPITWGTITLGE